MYYLEHQGSRWVGFSSQKNRELKLKYLRKLFDNNILCLQEVYGKDEYLQAIQVLSPRFTFFFLVPLFLETKMQGDRLFALTRICFLRMLL